MDVKSLDVLFTITWNMYYVLHCCYRTPASNSMYENTNSISILMDLFTINGMEILPEYFFNSVINFQLLPIFYHQTKVFQTNIYLQHDIWWWLVILLSTIYQTLRTHNTWLDSNSYTRFSNASWYYDTSVELHISPLFNSIYRDGYYITDVNFVKKLYLFELCVLIVSYIYFIII